MPLQLVNANAVIVANQFNPTVFSQYWLISNHIIGPNDFESQACVFSPMVTQIMTHRFSLSIFPEQLQFAPVESESQQDLALATVGRIVELLPHTPYTAAGLNFVWHVTPEQTDFAQFSRALFYRKASPLYREFDAEDARFGAYMSKTALGFRLKLDIKPTMLKVQDGPSSEVMQFAFNYHRDIVAGQAVQGVQDLLRQWNSAKDYSLQIVESTVTGANS